MIDYRNRNIIKILPVLAAQLLVLLLACGCGQTGGSLQEQAGEAVSAESETAASSEGGASAAVAAEDGQTAAEDKEKDNPSEEDQVTEITFTAVGDNLINEVLYGQAAERAARRKSDFPESDDPERDAEKSGGPEEDGLPDEDYDFTPVYAQVAPFIAEQDVNWIDIETLITDTCEPSGYPSFSTPGASGRALRDAGWNVFSLCSNHTYDLGSRGISATLDFWKQMMAEASKDWPENAQADGASFDEYIKENILEKEGGICCTGLWEYGTEDTIPVLTCKGKKLAFLTYTYGTNNIKTPADSPGHVIYLDEEDVIARQIALAHEQADAVIVSLHWGAEYNHYETQDQIDLAQRVADMGADLIIGGHPHVVEGAQMLTASDGRQVFCAYSLGNFICAQNAMPNPDAMIGLMLSCTFRFTEDGLTVKDHRLIPILSDYGDGYEDDHVVFYADYTEEAALAHGMRSMFGFTQFDYDYVREMLTDVVGTEYLQLP